MTSKILYLDRKRSMAIQLYSSLKKESQGQGFEILFAGPQDAKSFGLLERDVEGFVSGWTYNHFVRSVLKVVENEKPDIVHVSFELRTFGNLKSALKFPILLYLLKRKGIKTVVTLHNILVFRKNKRWAIVEDVDFKIPGIILKSIVRLFVKKISKYSDRIIVLTELNKKGLHQYYGVDDKKITVIPEGLSDSSSMGEKISKKLQNKRFILCFGFITPRKGQLQLLESFRIIKEKYSDISLVIAGRATPDSQEYEKKCRELVQKNNLHDSVTFTGFLSDPDVEWLFENTLLAVYPYQESPAFPAALTFAIKHGVPVVATRTDSFFDILGEECGVLVDSDAQSLSEGMTLLLGDEKTRELLSKRILDLGENFDWNSISEKYFGIYKVI